MHDWVKKLNDILIINERQILEHAGRITKQLADEMAEKQYEAFKLQQQISEKAESLNELERDLKKFGSGKKAP